MFIYKKTNLCVLEEVPINLFHGHFNTTKTILILTSVLVLTTISMSKPTQIPQKTSNDAVPKLLILDDCDKDNDLGTPPFGDTILLLNSQGDLKKYVHRLRTNNVRGALSVSEDGRFFIVCENALNRLIMYETATGREFWSLSGIFTSATISNNIVYAINIQNAYAIDTTGTIIKHIRSGGIDIAVDQSHDCIWIVGNKISKYNPGLQPEFEISLTQNPSHAAAFSVDICPDGSAWVAERSADEINSGRNKLVKISSDGEIIKSTELNFYPLCIRTNPSDGSVWVTGYGSRDFTNSSEGQEWPDTLAELNDLAPKIKYTQKYDSKSNLLLSINQCGNSIDLDPSDGSIWIADNDRILHYSNTGEKLGEYTDVSEGRKWLAIVPKEKPGV